MKNGGHFLSKWLEDFRGDLLPQILLSFNKIFSKFVYTFSFFLFFFVLGERREDRGTLKKYFLFKISCLFMDENRQKLNSFGI